MPIRGRKPLKSASERLTEQLSNGEVYEAHQTCCTLYNRTLNKGSEHWNGAKLLLLELSKTFLEHNEPMSALDLIEKYVEDPEEQIGTTTISKVQAKKTATLSDESNQDDEGYGSTYLYQFLGKEKLMELLPLFKNGSDEKKVFLKSVNAFAVKCLKKDDPEIVTILLDEYLTVHNYSAAVKCINSCDDATILSKYPVILREWSKDGYQTEKDLFYLRAMLHLLANNPGKYTLIRTLQESILEEASELKEVPSMNFLKLLLDLIEFSPKENHPSNTPKAKLIAYEKKKQAQQHTFQTLIKFYAPFILERDTKLNALLERIGALHFGIQQAQNPMQAMMSSLMGGGGGDGGMGLLGGPGGFDMSKMMGMMNGMM